MKKTTLDLYEGMVDVTLRTSTVLTLVDGADACYFLVGGTYDWLKASKVATKTFLEDNEFRDWLVTFTENKNLFIEGGQFHRGV